MRGPSESKPSDILVAHLVFDGGEVLPQGWGVVEEVYPDHVVGPDKYRHFLRTVRGRPKLTWVYPG